MNDTVRDFLTALYGGCKDVYVGITKLPGRTTQWFPSGDIGRIMTHAADSGEKTNTYLNIFPRKSVPSGASRGAGADVSHVNCVFIDADIRSDAHAEKCLPESIEEALAAVRDIAEKPSFIFSTGNGIHVYWVFRDPLIITDEEERLLASAVVSGFCCHAAGIFSSYGWKLDSVGDLSRMMRFPGTLNFRNNPPFRGEVIEASGLLYSFDDFRKYASDVRPTLPGRKDRVSVRPMGSAGRIIEGCSALRFLKDHPADVPEPLWFMAASNISLAPDGAEVFHELSSPYPGYRPEETEAKIRAAVKASKPCTCAYISSHGGDCPEGGCGIKAPIVLAFLRGHEVLEELMKEDFSLEKVFSEANLAAAQETHDSSPAVWAVYREWLRSHGVSLRDFDRAAKETMRKAASRMRVSAEEDFADSPRQAVTLPGKDMRGVLMPYGYRLTDKGVVRSGVPELGIEDRIVCARKMVLASKIINADSGTVMLEVAVKNREGWRFDTVPRSALLSRTSIVKLCDLGLPVSSDNADAVVKYVSDFEESNEETLPALREISRMGWIGADTFFPHVNDSGIVHEDPESTLLKALKPEGDKKKWFDMAEKLRTLPFARLQLAVAFASPLVELLHIRIPILHVWNDSRSGKTAGAKMCASVYGNPNVLMRNFNSTAVGLEFTAGELRNIVMVIDELQQKNRNTDLSALMYQLGNGQGRTRGSRSCGLRVTPVWSLAVLSTGEHAIAESGTMDGVISRVMQLYEKPIPDTELASEVHRCADRSYGHAAEPYLRFVISRRAKVREDFEAMRMLIKEGLEEDAGPYIDGITAFALGDCYSSVSLFGLGDEDAWNQAVDLAITALTGINRTLPPNTIESSWDFIMSWITENRIHLAEGADPCYGKVTDDRVYISGNVMRRAFQMAGLSYDKAVRGFADRELIDTQFEADGTRRCHVPKVVNGTRVRMLALRLSLGPVIDTEEDFLK